MSKIVFPSLILYKVESVRNKDLNLYVSQPCDLFFLYLVRQCAKKRGRRKANHLLTLTWNLVSPERRCSSRTFRYGYLVTT